MLKLVILRTMTGKYRNGVVQDAVQLGLAYWLSIKIDVFSILLAIKICLLIRTIRSLIIEFNISTEQTFAKYMCVFE